MIDLKNLVIDTKEVEVEYPGIDKFKVKVRYISRAKSKELLESSEVKEFKNGMFIGTKRDENKFVDQFVAHCISGWSGLTLEGVSRLLLIDVEEQDLSKEVEYSHDNAVMLLKNSTAFNTFIDNTVFDLDCFRSRK